MKTIATTAGPSLTAASPAAMGGRDAAPFVPPMASIFRFCSAGVI